MKKIRFVAAVLVIVMIFSAAFTVSADIIKGDVDGNGKVDSNDAIYLLYSIFFPDNYPLNQPADFDANGKVDSNDAIYLLYHVFFSDQYPLENGTFPVGKDNEGDKYGPFIPFNH